jgi:hypothetical protein
MLGTARRQALYDRDVYRTGRVSFLTDCFVISPPPPATVVCRGNLEERFMAKRMSAKTIELKAGHVSLISQPDAIANLILDAAGQT